MKSVMRRELRRNGKNNWKQTNLDLKSDLGPQIERFISAQQGKKILRHMLMQFWNSKDRKLILKTSREQQRIYQRYHTSQ